VLVPLGTDEVTTEHFINRLSFNHEGDLSHAERYSGGSERSAVAVAGLSRQKVGLIVHYPLTFCYKKT